MLIAQLKSNELGEAKVIFEGNSLDSSADWSLRSPSKEFTEKLNYYLNTVAYLDGKTLGIDKKNIFGIDLFYVLDNMEDIDFINSKEFDLNIEDYYAEKEEDILA